MSRALVSLASLLSIAACTTGTPPSGPRVTVEVAALSLPGLGFACFDVEVAGGAGVVWSRGNPALTRFGDDQNGGTTTGAPDRDTLCSDDFGNGPAGDVAYIGTCDATADVDLTRAGVQNRVKLWVDALADEAGEADVGGWTDPCPSGCAVVIDCLENADTRASFDLTIARRATQGFFDVAVDLGDVFCSAKVDTCDDDDRPLALLFGGDGVRDWTAVAALACTAGPGAADSELLHGPVAVTCGALTFPIDLRGDPGNREVTVAGHTLHYGLYRGREALTCGGQPCRKLYENVALSLDDLHAFGLGECRLTYDATAALPGELPGGVPAGDGRAWPYVRANVLLTDADSAPRCQQQALGDDALTTVYAGTLDGLPPPIAMCTRFDGDAPESTGADGCGGEPGPDPDIPNDPCPSTSESVATNGVLAALSGPNLTNLRFFPVERLQCIESIGGDLYAIQNTTSTSAFANLRNIGGDLYFAGNTGVTSLSLPSLATIGKDFILSGNTSLSALAAPKLTSARGLLVENGTALTAIDLPLLTGGPTFTLRLVGNPALATLDVPGLADAARLEARNNGALSTCALRALMTRLGGPDDGAEYIFDLDLDDCPGYDSTSPCPDGPITVASLTIDASHPAPNLECIGSVLGTLRVAGSDLEALTLPNLVHVGQLEIVDNASLVSIGSPRLASAGPITVRGNPALGSWYAPYLVAVGDFTVTDNAPLSTCALRDIMNQSRDQSPDATYLIARNAPDCPSRDDTAVCPDGPLTVVNLFISPSDPPPPDLACIVHVTGTFQIAFSSLTALTLPALTQVGTLYVSGNTALEHLSLPALTAVGWGMVYDNAALTSLDLDALTGTATLELEISLNPLLDTVGLDALAAAQSFRVIINPSLSTCEMYPVAARLDPTAAVELVGNLADCAYPCAPGTWFDDDALVCAPCSALDHCAALTCIDGTASTCTVCDPGYEPDGGACALCAPDQYGDGTRCDDCDAIADCEPGAVRCTGAADEACLDCTPGHHLVAGQCAAGDCPGGQWFDGDVCQPCPALEHCTEATCTSPSDATCVSCAEGFALDGGACAPVAECGLFGLACPEGFACLESDALGTAYPAFCVGEHDEVWVPAGDFWMGCNTAIDTGCLLPETPQHLVHTDAFAIDRTEVTADEFFACVIAGACTAPGDNASATWGVPEKAAHPINNVDWNQAAAYCAWSGKPAGAQRLCSEAEWEKAARGGCETLDGDCQTGMRIFPWGSTAPGYGCTLANWGYCDHPQPGPTATVGSIPGGASPYGARDMMGNVIEWIAPTWYSYPGYSPAFADASTRMMRGGGYNTTAQGGRTSGRNGGLPQTRLDYLGIRCCRSLP